MNLTHPSGRIALHLRALAHRPGHFRFHLSGIARDLPETGIPGLVAALAWLIIWTALSL